MKWSLFSSQLLDSDFEHIYWPAKFTQFWSILPFYQFLFAKSYKSLFLLLIYVLYFSLYYFRVL